MHGTITSTVRLATALLLVVALAALQGASARVYNFTLDEPNKVYKPGENVTVRYLCEGYIQNNAQLFATFGLSGFPLTEKAPFIGSPQFSPKDFTALGAPIATGGCPRNPDTHKYAGYATQITLPKYIDSITDTNYNATSFKQETQTLSTALWGTVGASGLLTQQVFRVNITVVPNEAA